MKEYTKDLGKVILTPEGIWDNKKEYERLSIVYDENNKHAYISHIDVPIGIDITDSRYWMPLNVSGYSDSNMTILNELDKNGNIISYTLDEAIKSISNVARRKGSILSFYNNNLDRNDVDGRWEIWQFNGLDLNVWEDKSNWINIYYNYNKFIGWFKDYNSLINNHPNPTIGQYAYVGNILNESTIYRCDKINEWENTYLEAKDYIKVIVGGNVRISNKNTWVVNGIDTNIPASVKGDDGKTPYLRWNNGVIEYSYDEKNWNIISDNLLTYFKWSDDNSIQVSKNNKDWMNLSPEFATTIYIKNYVKTINDLPDNEKVGSVYGVGPIYDEEDVDNVNPIYTIYVFTSKGWINNGKFNSLSAGIVQTFGDSETEVISQKTITEKFLKHDLIFGNKINIIGHGKDYTHEQLCKVEEGVTYNIRVLAKNLHYTGTESQSYMLQLGDSSNVFIDIDKSKSNSYINNLYKYTAEKDDILYINSRIASTDNVYIYIQDISSNNNSAEKLYTPNSELSNMLDEISSNTNKIVKKIPVSKNIGHSSTYNRISCCIDKGSIIKFIITNDLEEKIPIIFYFYTKNEVITYSTVSYNNDDYHVAVDDYISVGWYVPGKNIDFTLTVEINWGSKLINDLINYPNIQHNIPTDNVFNPNKFIIGFINNKGEFSTLNNGNKINDVYASDYILCFNKKYFYCSYEGRDYTYLAFYDKNLKVLETHKNEQKIYIIPENAYYIRASLSYYVNNTGFFTNTEELPKNINILFKDHIWATNYLKSKQEYIDILVPEKIIKTGIPEEWVSIKYNIYKNINDKIPILVIDGDASMAINENQSSWFQIYVYVNNNKQLILNWEPKYINTPSYLIKQTIDLSNYKNITEVEVLCRFHESEQLVTTLSYADSVTKNTDSYYYDNKYLSVIANRYPSTYNKSNKNIFTLFAIQTDVHDSYPLMHEIFSYVDSNNIACTLTLGDIFDNSNKMNTYDWTNNILNYNKPILSVIGNHEVLSREDMYIKGVTNEDIKNYFYNDTIINHNNAIHSDNKLYWYKDFKQLDKTIRIIGLYQYEYEVPIKDNGYPEYGQNSGKGKDTIYYSQEQIDWLINVLDSCDDNTYVIILSHYAISKDNEYADKEWNPSLNIRPLFSGGDDLDGQTNYDLIPQIVQSWIDGSSVNSISTMKVDNTSVIANHKFKIAHYNKFISYISGHTHNDAIGYLKNYPNQKQISLACTTNIDPQQGNDLVRDDHQLKNCFTILSYDHFNNVINMVRLGADITIDGRNRKFVKF